MAESNSRTVLNHLIESCTDGEHGFRHAAELVTDPGLKSLFAAMAARRAQFAADLLPHAQRLGGAAAADGTAGATLHRRWMDVRSRLSDRDDRTVLAEVRRGDNVTVLAFKDAISGMLPATVRDLVERQYAEACGSHTYFDQFGLRGM